MRPRHSKSRNQLRDPRVTATSKWEWISGGLGLLLVLTMLGYIGTNAMTSEPSVPAITFDRLSTEPTTGGYVVTFRARNSGPSTAASLLISGGLSNGSRIIETSDVTLDYLPPLGERRGGLIFRNNPDRYQLRLEPKSYVEP
jgi:uncharacterized protein (TIGR02588 family)